jgi:photosystem II stability/assembly factor-like uncharacterized protein
MSRSTKLHLCCCALLLLSATAARPQTRDGWEKIDHCNLRRETKSGNTFIHFFDDRQRGVIAGDAGFIRYTRNGGVTWRKAHPPRHDPQFSENVITGSRRDETIYLVTLQHLLYSKDGGASWSFMPQPLTRGQLTGDFGISVRVEYYDIFFANEKRGWVLCGAWTRVNNKDDFKQAYVLRTKNGGNTWERHALPTKALVVQMRIADERRGWAVGENGAILRTDNGGETWRSQRYPEREGERPPAQRPMLLDVDSRNEDTAIVVGEQGTILRTQDGGETWFIISPPALNAKPDINDLLRVQMVNEREAWIVGNGGDVLYSYDAGSSWMRQEVPITADLYAVFMSNSDLGWAAGNKNALLRFDADDVIPPNAAAGERSQRSRRWLREEAGTGGRHE